MNNRRTTMMFPVMIFLAGCSATAAPAQLTGSQKIEDLLVAGYEVKAAYVARAFLQKGSSLYLCPMYAEGSGDGQLCVPAVTKR